MEPSIDIVSALSGAVAEITEQVGGALPVALPVAGALLAVSIGWKIFKRFVRG